MKNKPFRLRAWYEIALSDTQDHAEFLNLLLRENLFYENAYHDADGTLHLYISKRDADDLARAGKLSSFSVTILHTYGFLEWIRRYRHRSGILCGMVLFLLMVLLSGNFVWKVEVTGNTNLTEAQIRQGLEALGCGVGSYIPHLDRYAISDRYLRAESGLSYVSVNRKGNVLHVMVRERVSTDAVDDSAPCNLIAAEDGVIVYTTINDGMLLVKPGEVVRAGALLVGGVMEDTQGNTFITHATGHVYARVVRTITVEIPYEETVVTGYELVGSEKMLKIFGKTIKISKNCGNLPPTYDTIQTELPLTFPGGTVLPLSRIQTSFLIPKVKRQINDKSACKIKAEKMLSAKLSALSSEADIQSRQILFAGEAEQGYRMVCEVVLITDIAQVCTIETAAP